ncbi:MAG: SAM-dependent methyltransferase, partial [Verrucomicrobiota bacterium]|nr:SAM-dependent methyltransferase [Verrucomicrobiota bacterium]
MPLPIQRPGLLLADRWSDYALLDCGDGMKQERWGDVTLVRPDPQIIWPRSGDERRRTDAENRGWKNWDGFYHRSERGGGRWEFRRALPESWTVRYASLGLTFKI